MALRLSLDTLLLYDPNRSHATVNVWVAHPTPTEEYALGKLFVVSAIMTPSRLNHEIISIVQEELRERYYRSTDLKPDIAFEQSLQQLNQRLHQLIADGVADWLPQAHILVGLIHHQQLILSSIGAIHSYLIRHGRIHDIAEAGVAKAPNPLRIFESVVSGQLATDDRLLFCTASLLDYFSVEKLRRTISDHAPTDAVRNLETTLLGVEREIAFAALVILAETAEPRPAFGLTPLSRTAAARVAPQVSMEQLIAREQATEKLLSPSIWPAIKDVFDQVRAAASRTFGMLILRRPPRRVISGLASSRTASQTTLSAWVNLLRAVGRGLAAMARAAVQAVRVLLRRPAGAGLHLDRSTVQAVPRPSVNRMIVWFQRLGRPQRTIVVALAILIVVLAGSLAVKGRSPVVTKGKRADTVAASVREKIQRADAALLYGGEDTARQFVTDAAALVATLPKKTERDRTRRSPLLADLARLTRALSHQTIIDQPEHLIDLSTQFPAIHPNQLFLLDGQLVAYDPSTVTPVVTPLRTPTQAFVIKNTLDIGTPTTGTVGGGSTVLLATDRLEFVEIDTAKKTWHALTVGTGLSTAARIQSISVFQNRVYVLDAAGQKILRFNRGVNGLGDGTSWLKESANVKAGRTMVVDGSIYVLQPGGRVTEYEVGRQTSFALGGVTPPVTDLTRLWTTPASQRLYVIEPKTHRLIVFGKNGTFIAQYESPVWTRLRDVVVDEKTGQAYVLNGTTIDVVPLGK